MSVTFSESRPGDEAAIADFERRVGLALPRAYREWLVGQDGGAPEPSGFNYKGESGPYTDSSVSGLSNLRTVEGNIAQYKVKNPRLPEDLIRIGSDPFGNWICIATHGPNAGRVYFWDHEEEQDEPTHDNCHLLADDFAEFLENLH